MRPILLYVRLIPVSAAVFFAWAPAAHAQIAAPAPVPDMTAPAVPPDLQSVAERPQPELDPLGIRVGAFTINSSLDVGEMFTDNVYGVSFQPKSDFVLRVAPVLDIRSDWDQHALDLHAEGDIQQYARYGNQNRNDLILQADGRLDIQRGQYLSLKAGFQIQHEDPSAPDSQAAAEAAGAGAFALYPTEYRVETAEATYVYAPRRIGVSLDAAITSYQFSNEPTANGGLAINSDRSRNEFVVTPRVSYEIEPGYQLFVETAGNMRIYDSTFDSEPDHLKRSSSGYSIAAGYQFSTGGPVNGSIAIGWSNQIYDDARLQDNGGLYVSGTLRWNVTSLTTMDFAVSRQVEETILLDSSGDWDTGVSASIAHELLRDVLLTGRVAYNRFDYEGIDRNDSFYQAGLGVRWKFSRNFSLGLDGNWQNRGSNVPGSAFDRETLLLHLTASL